MLSTELFKQAGVQAWARCYTSMAKGRPASNRKRPGHAQHCCPFIAGQCGCSDLPGTQGQRPAEAKHLGCRPCEPGLCEGLRWTAADVGHVAAEAAGARWLAIYKQDTCGAAAGCAVGPGRQADDAITAE